MNLDSIPIFVINLRSAVGRLKKMTRKLKRYGLDFVRIEASLPDQVVGNYVGYLSGTQRACTYSHLRVLRQIVVHNIPAALVLEDDIVFRSDWKEIVNTKLKALETEDPSWDALFLNVAEPYAKMETWHVARDQCLAGAYIITKDAAAWILGHFSAQYYCIDWMTQVLQQRGHSYTYYPWLAIQEGNESYNGSNVDADYAKVERCLEASVYGLENYDF